LRETALQAEPYPRPEAPNTAENPESRPRRDGSGALFRGSLSADTRAPRGYGHARRQIKILKWLYFHETRSSLTHRQTSAGGDDRQGDRQRMNRSDSDQLASSPLRQPFVCRVRQLRTASRHAHQNTPHLPTVMQIPAILDDDILPDMGRSARLAA
jgi:hypothetical protein